MHVLHRVAERPHLVLPRLGLRQNGHPDAAVWVLGHLQAQSWAAGACCFHNGGNSLLQPSGQWCISFTVLQLDCKGLRTFAILYQKLTINACICMRVAGRSQVPSIMDSQQSQPATHSTCVERHEWVVGKCMGRGVQGQGSE